MDWLLVLIFLVQGVIILFALVRYFELCKDVSEIKIMVSKYLGSKE